MKKLLITVVVVCIAIGASIQVQAQHPCTATVEVNSSDFTFTIPCAVVGSSADGMHDSLWIQFKLNNGPPFEVVDFSEILQNDPYTNALAQIPKTGCTFSTKDPVVPVQKKEPHAAAPVNPPDVIGPVSSHLRGDGDLQRGAPWPRPRFTDNANGTVTDHLTGLIWLKYAACEKFFVGDSSSNKLRYWENALTAANKLGAGFCGLTDGSSAGDWRLPNRFELESLLHLGVRNPALPNTDGTGKWEEDDPFTGLLFEPRVWSSTSASDYPDHAYFIDLISGTVNVQSKLFLKTIVWPVRGGR